MPKDTQSKRVEVFRPGTYTAMNGTTTTFSAEDVEAIAGGYDADSAPAPVVVGHPSHDDPAYGWVKGFSISEDGKLQAELHQLAPSFVDAVGEGRYRKISMSFFTPQHPANPKPGSYYPKHVGFLGGAAPAVSGLQPVQFAEEGDDLVVEYVGSAEVARISAGLFRAFRDWLIEQAGVEKADGVIPSWRVSWLEELGSEKDEDDADSAFSADGPSATPPQSNEGGPAMAGDTPDALNARETALAAKEAALREKEAAFTVDGWIADGKLPPALKGQAVQLLSFVDGADGSALEYASGETATPAELLRALVDGLPKSVDFSETAAGDTPDDTPAPRSQNYQITAGADVNPESAAMDALAQEYMSKNPGADYLTAINAVQK